MCAFCVDFLQIIQREMRCARMIQVAYCLFISPLRVLIRSINSFLENCTGHFVRRLGADMLPYFSRLLLPCVHTTCLIRFHLVLFWFVSRFILLYWYSSIHYALNSFFKILHFIFPDKIYDISSIWKFEQILGHGMK